MAAVECGWHAGRNYFTRGAGLSSAAPRDQRRISARKTFIASPEYNSSVTAALKNAIDWVSRADSDDEPMLSALAGKAAVICSASPGALGGLRGLVHLRSILGNIGITVLPDQLAVGSAYQSFAADGSLADAKQADRARKLGSSLAGHLAKLLA
jgi:chromate reductase, NAD(P)H dehydrogenase (quinone)